MNDSTMQYTFDEDFITYIIYNRISIPNKNQPSIDIYFDFKNNIFEYIGQ